MTTADDSSDSLIAALSKARIPSDNHKYIQRLMSSVDIRDYRAVPKSDKPYVVAVREDGLPDLRIFSGYTIGFTTGEEAQRVGFGSDTIRASDDAGKVWLVSHPVHGGLDKRGPADQTKRRDPGKCPRCGIYELSVGSATPATKTKDHRYAVGYCTGALVSSQADGESPSSGTTCSRGPIPRSGTVSAEEDWL